MSQLWLPATTALTATALTYLFCIRPMRRGHCTNPGRAARVEATELDRDLDRMLLELAQLQADTGHAGRGHAQAPRVGQRVTKEARR